jgi:hypothetical protein
MHAQRVYLVAFCLVASVVVLSSAAQSAADILPATAVSSYTPGYFTTDQLAAFGAPVQVVVPPGGSYAGIGSQVTAVAGSATTTGTAVYRLRDPYAIHQPEAVPGFLGSTLTIMAGVNATGTSQTISMAWRSRTDIETNSVGYPCVLDGMQQPPAAYDTYGLGSDVVHLEGVSGAYALQMSYDPAALVWEAEWVTEEYLCQHDKIFLGWLEDAAAAGGGMVSGQEWVHAAEANTGVGEHVYANYQGSLADFVAEHPDFTPEGYLGSYGVSYADKTVWAVIDHNSQFGAIPEPATAMLLAAGALVALVRLRRSRLA